MKFRPLGRTDLAVSEICLGTMTFGQQTGADDAFAQMDHAVAQGINFFDTAELYSIPPRAETYGATETIIGAWLEKARPPRRSDHRNKSRWPQHHELAAPGRRDGAVGRKEYFPRRRRLVEAAGHGLYRSLSTALA